MAVELKRGEDLKFVITVEEGTVTGSETVTAVLKRAVRGIDSPGDGEDPALTMSATFAAASGGTPDRWYLNAAGSATAGLVAGKYVTDVKFVQGGITYMSPTVQVNVIERVTE